MDNLTNWLKKNIGIIIIIISFLAIIIIGLINGMLPHALDSIRKADFFYILLAIVFYQSYIFINGLSQKSFINSQGYAISIKESFYSAVASIYYANITPFSAGGIPTQIYYLSKQEVPVGVASASVTCFVNAWNIMRLFLMIVFFITRRDFLENALGNNMIFLYIGFLYNLYIIFLFLFFGFARRPVQYLIKFLDKIIRKLHLSKNPDNITFKLTKTVDTYHDAMQKNPDSSIRNIQAIVFRIYICLSVKQYYFSRV